MAFGSRAAPAPQSPPPRSESTESASPGAAVGTEPSAAQPPPPSPGNPAPASPVQPLAAFATASVAPWVPQNELLWATLDELADQLNAPQQAREWYLLAGGSLSAAYVIWNMRALYSLLSLVFSTPLWRQFDPLAILDVWDNDKKKRRGLPGVRNDKDDDERLQPILG